MNKSECIDEIIKKFGSRIEHVDDNPDYSVPVGLPNINLEIRTEKTVELYVLVDVNSSENLIKDVDEAYEALCCAASQVNKEGKPLFQWIQLFNASKAQLEKYESEIIRLLESKMSESPKLRRPEDMLPCSIATRLYHQTGKAELN
jgi:hypothetical protein